MFGQQLDEKKKKSLTFAQQWIRLFWNTLSLFWSSFEALLKLFWCSFDVVFLILKLFCLIFNLFCFTLSMFWACFELVLTTKVWRKLLHSLSHELWSTSRGSGEALEPILIRLWKLVRHLVNESLTKNWRKLNVFKGFFRALQKHFQKLLWKSFRALWHFFGACFDPRLELVLIHVLTKVWRKFDELLTEI